MPRHRLGPVARALADSDEVGPRHSPKYKPKPENSRPKVEDDGRQKAVAEAMALLAVGATAPSQRELREWIDEVVRMAHHYQDPKHEQEIIATEGAREKVLEAVKSLRRALQDVRDFEMDGLSMCPPDPPGLDDVLDSLERWAEPLDWWLRHRPGRGKKKSGPRRDIPVAVIQVHIFAKELLEKFGLKATIGNTKAGGGPLTQLGALLCKAAGIDLPAGESTKAAELVGSTDRPKWISHSSGRLWPYEPLDS